MRFVFKIPTSVNQMYRSGRNNRRYKTQEALDWQQETLQEIMVQKRGQKKPIGDTIYVNFYRDNKRRFDSGNHTKLLYDTLVKAGILEDDNDLIFEQLQKIKSDKSYCEVEVL